MEKLIGPKTVQNCRIFIILCILICLQLETAKEEISTLKKKCEDCEQEITRLKSDLQRLSGDYGRVATRSRIVSITLSSCWWFDRLS